MKSIAKKLMTLGLAAALATTLAACDNPFADHMLKDSEVYVQGQLDAYYKGVASQEYLDLIDVTAEEVTEVYEDGLLVEAEYFMYYFDVADYTDEMTAAVADLYREIYSHSKYTVKPATSNSDGNYIVTVEVEPIDVMLQITEEQLTPLYDLDDAGRCAGAIELVKAALTNVGYEDMKSVAVQIVSEDGTEYEVVGDDLTKLDEIIIAY